MEVDLGIILVLKTGKGIRFGIVHAGNTNEFVKNASLIFKFNKNQLIITIT